MSDGKISVIVACYNLADHIGDCIAALAAQSVEVFEVLIIDDGSTDSSVEVAQAAIGEDQRFHLISQPNGGLSAARNAGLERAGGDYIAFVDGDDRVAPDWLARMYDALRQHDADWVACGLRYCRADGTGKVHSAIHDAPDLADDALPHRYALDSWTDVVRHFPSAWNKLYRRRLIEGLRFDEGTYFEDHAFFYRAASRTDHLVHVPEPLYLQTQGREGQITREDSDRVFEQFPVLDTMHDIMQASDKPDKEAAFQRIASRLVFERATALADPVRRTRFARAARRYFAANDLSYRPDWDEGISRTWRIVMEGRLPLSVIVPTDQVDQALADTVASLAAQTMRDFETLIVIDSDDDTVRQESLALARDLPRASVLMNGSAGLAAARNRGFDVTRGDYVVFFDAGDRLEPGTLAGWVEAMERRATVFGFSRFRIGLADDAPQHNGFHDSTGREERLVPGVFTLDPASVLALHAHPSAKIFRRDFLLDHDIRFPPGPLSSWSVTLQAALMAGEGAYFARPGLRIADRPEARRIWRQPETPQALAQALERMAETFGETSALPHGWYRQLFARALWEKLNFAAFPDAAAMDLFCQQARDLAAALPLEGDTLDPYVGPRVQELLTSAGR
ncbi:glycosyltransferase family 2 protein [Thalassococcus sp. S3]|uniref:glycosyltransferase family 2 protein n=1 Tax=Thalassococcus sp. S3 TaxID=2017482 RepID=UPI0010247F51|nr:glycosyltransferase family 2 protein [Thalassococcus sp. S3]QBF34246.1 hypothetical protein CFI11_23970 [Thalassococcus sp. S3]